MTAKTLAVMLAAAILSVLAASLQAAEITLQWNANTETDLAGYRLFRSSTSLLATTPEQAMADAQIVKITIADPGSTSITVTGLATRTTYYFRLTAFDASNNQSAFNLDALDQPAEVLVMLPDDPVVNPDPVADPDPASQPGPAASQQFLSPGLVDGKNDVAVFGDQAEEVRIYNLQGRLIFSVTSSASGPLTWNGKDDQGRQLPSGPYIVKIKKQDGTIRYQTYTIVK